MSTPIIVLAGQSNAARLSSDIEASLTQTYGAGGYVLVRVYAAGAPLTRMRDEGTDWLEEGDMRDLLISATLDALDSQADGQIAGLIWVQGEGDTHDGSSPNRYDDEFRDLIGAWQNAVSGHFGRGQTGVEDASIILSGLSTYAPESENRRYWSDVDAAITDLGADYDNMTSVDPDSVAGRAGVSTAGMFSDGLHYSPTFSPVLSDALVAALHSASGAAQGSGSTSGGGTSGGSNGTVTGQDTDVFRADGTATEMAGGAGDDIYYYDDSGDVIIEEDGGGQDIVYAAMSIELRTYSQFIEDLTLLGTGNLTAAGNASDNVITGNTGHNHLNGAWGDDLITGVQGNDTLNGHVGNDTLRGGSGQDYVLGGAGDDDLAGNIGADTLDGEEGADTIYGWEGYDLLYGGAGNDLMLGNAGADTVRGGDGADTLHGGINYDLLIGGADDDLIFGNNGGDTLYGSGGHDRLEANAGADQLDGGSGSDTLVGGIGADTFVFSAGYGWDRIADFQPGIDVVQIDRDLMGEGNPDASDLSRYARQNGDGNLVLDFGGGEVLTFTGIATVGAILDDVAFI